MRRSYFFVIFLIISSSIVFAQENLNLYLHLKVFLQGDFVNGKMLTILKDKDYIPLTQPYKSPPWKYDGNEKVSSIPDDVVDWILISLVNPNTDDIITKACFLKSNGDICDLEGNDYVEFKNFKKGVYFLIIYHRNHLPLSTSVPIRIDNQDVSLDFTKGKNPFVDSSSVAYLGGGNYGMISGDSNSDDRVDRSDFLDVAKNIFKVGYNNADLDMNGVVNVLDYQKVNDNMDKEFIPKINLK